MRVALFACYCPKDLTANQRCLLDDLKNSFDCVLALIATERHSLVKQEPCEKIRFFLRPNSVMQDFALWKFGLSQLNPNDIDELCLLNDSCMRMSSLHKLFGLSYTCQSLTKSWESLPGFTQSSWEHMQSYFLQFQRPAIADVFHFFAGARDVTSRIQLVNEQEIGLSQALLKKGHTLTELYPRRLLNYASKRQLRDTDNSSYIGWLALALVGCPLIKTKRAEMTHTSQLILQNISQDLDIASKTKRSSS